MISEDLAGNSHSILDVGLILTIWPAFLHTPLPTDKHARARAPCATYFLFFLCHRGVTFFICRVLIGALQSKPCPYTIAGLYKNAQAAQPKVTLVQSGPRLLDAYNKEISDIALREMRSAGIEVLLNQRVKKVIALIFLFFF